MTDPGSTSHWQLVETEGHAVIALDGEIDLAVAPSLGTELVDQVAKLTGDVVLDCSDLTFIDSTGLKALLRVQQSLEADGRTLALRNVSDACRRPIEICGLTEVLGVAAEDAPTE